LLAVFCEVRNEGYENGRWTVQTVSAWNILVRKHLWRPVLRSEMRRGKASICTFRKGGYENGRWMELERSELIQHRISAPYPKMISYEAGGGWRLSTVVFVTVTRWRHVTVSSCTRLYRQRKSFQGAHGSLQLLTESSNSPVSNRIPVLGHVFYLTNPTLSRSQHSATDPTCSTLLNKTLLLYNRTNEPTDRFNYYITFVYTYSSKAMTCILFWSAFSINFYKWLHLNWLYVRNTPNRSTFPSHKNKISSFIRVIPYGFGCADSGSVPFSCIFMALHRCTDSSA
jgi:hypothetical protein